MSIDNLKIYLLRTLIKYIKQVGLDDLIKRHFVTLFMQFFICTEAKIDTILTELYIVWIPMRLHWASHQPELCATFLDTTTLFKTIWYAYESIPVIYIFKSLNP